MGAYFVEAELVDGSEGGGVEEAASMSSSNESIVLGRVRKQCRGGQIERCEADKVESVYDLLGQAKARDDSWLRRVQSPLNQALAELQMARDREDSSYVGSFPAATRRVELPGPLTTCQGRRVRRQIRRVSYYELPCATYPGHLRITW